MIEEIIHKNPDKKLFITPESALYNPDSIPLLKEHSYFTTPDTTVIVGSFSPTGDTFYNTLFCIQQGAVAHLHHKQHTVALVEGLPSWCSFTWLMKLHGGSPSIARGPRVNDTWRISDTLSLDPYTCSELFCSRAPRDNASPESTILICCNDSWFAGWMRYAARLMVADARLKAILWKKNCLYIGYQYAGYITTNGEFFPL
jgi:apolipoprotein N-acyltransferase